MKNKCALLNIGILWLGLIPAAVIATDFSFKSSDFSGFAVDDYVQTFEFTLSQPQTVTIKSLGVSGGPNADEVSIRPGGFDPIVTLFDANGVWIDTNDDGPTGQDSELIAALGAGTYTVALTQFNNRAVGDPNGSQEPPGNLSEGFTGTTTTGFSGRSSHWALDILNADSADQLTPSQAQVVPLDEDRFLTFFNAVSPAHRESEATARAYYDAVDPPDEVNPNGSKTTLTDWKNAHGFDGSEVKAIYVNEADLGFGRRMYVKTLANGVASYVENYTRNDRDDSDPGGGPLEEKITNAHNGTNLLATVAMEYTAHPNDPSNRNYTKFYVFDSDGTRLTKVDLDGRGPKPIPGACNVCHGGNPRPLKTDGTYADFGDTGAGFLPWDLDVLGFSDTLFGGQYSRANQEAVLKTFNAAVLQTNPLFPAQQLIQGWYGGSTLPNAFNGQYVPSGWYGDPFYLSAVAPNCRACHIMRNQAVDLSRESRFDELNDRINHLVFDRGVMPLAKRTFGQFWLTSPKGGFNPNVGDRGPGNTPAWSFAGVDAPALVGFPVKLDASNSPFVNDESGFPGIEWTLESEPPGSTASLDDPNAERPEFTPNVAGDYIFKLRAANGQGTDFVDPVKISATTDGAATGIDFATQIVPIINGCIGCHKPEAAGTIIMVDGFPLYIGGPPFNAPEIDSVNEAIYRNLIQRVDVMQPDQSLLLKKATSVTHVASNPNYLTHVGSYNGPRLTTSDPDYLTLLTWISEGAPRVPLLPAPINDNFADARLINGVSGTEPGTNINAGKEPDEPLHITVNDGGKSVWWAWSAPISGNIEISTIGSDFDTVLAVYTGSSLDALTKVASDDDDGGSRTSLVNFPVTSGTTYFVAVDGYNYASEPEARSGTVQLNWDYPPPVNDTFASANVINGSAGQFSGSNSSATKEIGEPDHAGNTGGASIWYTWTPSVTGTYTLDTIGSDFDTLLAVYTGTIISALAEVNSDDDGGGLGTSSVTITVLAGQQYLIAIDGYNGAQGNFVLNLSEILADGDLNLDGVVNAADVLIGQRILTGDIIPTPLQQSHGDVAPLSGGIPAPDGQFNLGDLLVIERKALGQISF